MKLLRNMGIIICLIALMVTDAGAFAERVDRRKIIVRDLSSKNDVFLDDFNDITPGKMPEGYSMVILPEPCVVTTERTMGPYGKLQNSLLVNDAVGGNTYAGPYIRRNFGEISSGMYAFETRFKMERTGEHTHAGMRLYLRKGSDVKVRLSVAGTDDGSLSYQTSSSGSANLTNKKMIEAGKWYRLRIVVDTQTKLVKLLLESEALPTGYVYYENLALYQSYDSGAAVDNFAMECAQYDCSWYFDYIKVESGQNLDIEIPEESRVRPEPIQAPLCVAPVPRAVPNRYNVNLNGEYMYFSPEAKFENDELWLTSESVFRIFSLVSENGDLSASGELGKISFNADSSTVTVNSTDRTMKLKTMTQEKKVLVPLGAFSEAMGMKVDFKLDEKTMYITGGEEQ